MFINCKTFYSFRYGTIATKELVEMAVENGITALALTNINSTCDLWEFVKLCQEAAIKPVVGTEIRNGDELCISCLLPITRGWNGYTASFLHT